jgi:hypothetical protein
MHFFSSPTVPYFLFSGINALIYYTKDIFEMAGYGSQSALLQSVIVGMTNLIFTMAAMAASTTIVPISFSVISWRLCVFARD